MQSTFFRVSQCKDLVDACVLDGSFSDTSQSEHNAPIELQQSALSNSDELSDSQIYEFGRLFSPSHETLPQRSTDSVDAECEWSGSSPSDEQLVQFANICVQPNVDHPNANLECRGRIEADGGTQNHIHPLESPRPSTSRAYCAPPRTPEHPSYNMNPVNILTSTPVHAPPLCQVPAVDGLLNTPLTTPRLMSTSELQLLSGLHFDASLQLVISEDDDTGGEDPDIPCGQTVLEPPQVPDDSLAAISPTIQPLPENDIAAVLRGLSDSSVGQGTHTIPDISMYMKDSDSSDTE
jgi:hypothetical protein